MEDSRIIEASFVDLPTGAKATTLVAMALIAGCAGLNYLSSYVVKALPNPKLSTAAISTINTSIVLVLIYGPKLFLSRSNHAAYVESGLGNSSFNSVLWATMYVCNLMSYYHDPARLLNEQDSIAGVIKGSNAYVSAVRASFALVFDCITLVTILRHTETKMPLIKIGAVAGAVFGIGLGFIWTVYKSERTVLAAIHAVDDVSKVATTVAKKAENFTEAVTAMTKQVEEFEGYDDRVTEIRALLKDLQANPIFTTMRKIDGNKFVRSFLLVRNKRLALFSIILFLDAFMSLTGLAIDLQNPPSGWRYAFIWASALIPLYLDTAALYGIIDDINP